MIVAGVGDWVRMRPNCICLLLPKSARGRAVPICSRAAHKISAQVGHAEMRRARASCTIGLAVGRSDHSK